MLKVMCCKEFVMNYTFPIVLGNIMPGKWYQVTSVNGEWYLISTNTERWYPKSLFLTEQEYRNKQIDQLIVE